jgi:hypothetical protein
MLHSDPLRLVECVCRNQSVVPSVSQVLRDGATTGPCRAVFRGARPGRPFKMSGRTLKAGIPCRSIEMRAMRSQERKSEGRGREISVVQGRNKQSTVGHPPPVENKLRVFLPKICRDAGLVQLGRRAHPHCSRTRNLGVRCFSWKECTSRSTKLCLFQDPLRPC